MTLLITGGSGLIGSHLIKRLASQQEEKIVALMGRHKRFLPHLQGVDSPTYVWGDIRDTQFVASLVNHFHPQKIFHFCAHAIVKNASSDPVSVFDTNVVGLVNLLEAARRYNVGYTCVMETDKVYGNQVNAADYSPFEVTEAYGASKICQSVICETFRKTYGMKMGEPRSCNVYGFDNSDRIIPNTVRSCLRNEPPVIYEGDTSTRQYIYVGDVLGALEKMADSLWNEPLNICNVESLTQAQVVEEVLKHFPRLGPRYEKAEKRYEIQSGSMVPSVWPWSPKIKFPQGIALTVADFRRYAA